jgi:hypothetical protein
MRFSSPRAHRSEHSTTRCMESPTVLEHMAPFLFPSCAFSHASISSLFKLLSLADLHHVLAIPARHSAPLPPPPSLPYAGILASECSGKQCERSLNSSREVRATRRCLLSAERTREECSLDEEANELAASPFWLRGLSHFPFRSERRIRRFLSSAEIAGGARWPFRLDPVSGLSTPTSATAGRRPLSPRTTTHVRPFQATPRYANRRTPQPTSTWFHTLPAGRVCAALYAPGVHPFWHRVLPRMLLLEHMMV